MFQYVYIILNPTICGLWKYKSFIFEYQPIYVGIGVGYRCYEHLNMNRKKYESNYTKFNLIKSLIDNKTTPIILKLYENISKTEAKEIEIDIISHFGKLIENTGILTNITNGGDQTKCNTLGKENPHSKKVYQYSLSGNFINEWGCLREIGRKLNVPYNSIGDCCRGKTKTSNNFQWFYEYKGKKIVSIKSRDQPLNRKKVYKFDIFGNLVNTYVSLTEASNDNHILKSNLGSIILNCGVHDKHFYNYNNVFKLPKLYMSKYHLIRYHDEILFLTNPEIMDKFKVSKYYIIDVRRNRIKTPKFEIIK